MRDARGLRALVVDDQGGAAGRAFAKMLRDAGYEARFEEPALGLVALRSEPVNLLLVRQRTVSRSMDARPFAEAAIETAAARGEPRPWIVVFGVWDGTVTRQDVADFADEVLSIPADAWALRAAVGL